jgi:hypothetical protein
MQSANVGRLNGPAPCNDIDQAENIVVVISPMETAWGLPGGEPIPASVFFCSKADARHLASFGVRRETMSVLESG